MISKKRLLPLATALMLATTAAMAQTSPTPSATPTDADTMIVVPEGVIDISELSDTAFASDFDLPVQHSSEGFFVGDDGRLKLGLENGDIADFVSLVSDSMDLVEKPAWMIVAIMAIIFGVPCLCLIIVLCMLFNFLHRRNRERNDLIAKAIDNNYNLPDSFYSRQNPGYAAAPPVPGDNTAEGQQICQAAYRRNPRIFNSAMTLMVVGLCLFLFFAIVANAGVGFLIGGIPLFLGVGRMIAYYHVPGYSEMKDKYRPQQPQYPPYGNRQAPYYNNTYYNNGTGGPANFNNPPANGAQPQTPSTNSNGSYPPPPPPGYEG